MRSDVIVISMIVNIDLKYVSDTNSDTHSESYSESRLQLDRYSELHTADMYGHELMQVYQLVYHPIDELESRAVLRLVLQRW